MFTAKTLIKVKLKAGKFDKLYAQNYLQLFGLLLFTNFSVL